MKEKKRKKERAKMKEMLMLERSKSASSSSSSGSTSGASGSGGGASGGSAGEPSGSAGTRGVRGGVFLPKHDPKRSGASSAGFGPKDPKVVRAVASERRSERPSFGRGSYGLDDFGRRASDDYRVRSDKKKSKQKSFGATAAATPREKQHRQNSRRVVSRVVPIDGRPSSDDRYISNSCERRGVLHAAEYCIDKYGGVQRVAEVTTSAGGPPVSLDGRIYAVTK